MNNQKDKIKLLALTFQKVSADKNFMAYHLNQFAAIENKTPKRLADDLNSSLEQFYKLGLSKAPEAQALDYAQRLSAICDYTGVKLSAVNHLLQQVAQYQKVTTRVQQQTLEQALFSSWQTSNHAILHKTVEVLHSANQLFANLQAKVPAKLFKSGLALLCLVFSIFLSNTKVDDTAIYASSTKNYKHAHRYIAAVDNTHVHSLTLKKV